LFGANLYKYCDIIILVKAPLEKREKLLRAKCGLAGEDIRMRLKGQHLEVNKGLVNFIIENNGSQKSLYKKTEEIAEKIKSI